KPELVIIDSIQTMYHPDYPSTPGSIVQVRECSLRMQQLAKKENISIILVGHITKDGTVAGPKTLEHLVDVVLYLEGEKYHNIRILRAVKNRFGDISESGLFEMQNNGFIEISNPSKIFLSEKIQAPGSVIAVTLEGRRPILVEVQALVKKTVFGYPQRTSSGFDLNRLQLLIAVLEKRAGVDLANADVFLNIVGGLKIKEPAVDLAIITAITSAKNNLIIPDDYVFWGEVGLVGEIRQTISEKLREDETVRLGYTRWPKTKTIRELLSNLKLIT
ncbi:MAG: repair protein radA protein, partial [Berkelbacteria bacterium GW2011_GWA2_38_9]